MPRKNARPAARKARELTKSLMEERKRPRRRVHVTEGPSPAVVLAAEIARMSALQAHFAKAVEWQEDAE